MAAKRKSWLGEFWRPLAALLLWVLGMVPLIAAPPLMLSVAETRIGGLQPVPQVIAPAELLLSLDLHRACGPPLYDLASGCSVAANSGVRTNFNVYENLTQVEISGSSRAAHRASANRNLMEAMRQQPELRQMLNQELGADVAAHMQSGAGRQLINPPGAVWHHPVDQPGVMQLLRQSEHTNPALQPVLHPENVGGFATHYGN